MIKDNEFLIGFDLGGTKMQANVFDSSFNNLVFNRKKTRSSNAEEDIYSRIFGCIEGLLSDPQVEKLKLKGIGIGTPGSLDCEKGIVLDSPNLDWKNFPLRKKLEKDFKVPVAIDNDVNLGLSGEFHFGAGKGYRNLIGLFVGTGIGGALILNGEHYRGSTGNAGELGHVILDTDGPTCGCGQSGCLEALASRLAIASQAAVVALRGGAPNLRIEAGTDISKIRSGVIARSIEGGDRLIENIVRRSARYLGIAMGNYVNIFNPDAFILGGGLVEKMKDIYLEETRKAMNTFSLSFLSENVEIHAAQLGDDAAVMGAAKLIADQLERGIT